MKSRDRRSRPKRCAAGRRPRSIFDCTPNPDGSVDLEALLTIRIDRDGGSFYLPMLPCVTNFANAPAINVPAAGSPQPLSLPLDGVQGCEGTVYDLVNGEIRQGQEPSVLEIPTLGLTGLLAMAVLLAGIGWLVARR